MATSSNQHDTGHAKRLSGSGYGLVLVHAGGGCDHHSGDERIKNKGRQRRESGGDCGMAYTPTTNAGPELIALLRQRLTTEAGTLQRGAMSRIAEHLGTSYSAVHEWFKRGRRCNRKYHVRILQMIYLDHDFSSKKTGRKAGIKK